MSTNLKTREILAQPENSESPHTFHSIVHKDGSAIGAARKPQDDEAKVFLQLQTPGKKSLDDLTPRQRAKMISMIYEMADAAAATLGHIPNIAVGTVVICESQGKPDLYGVLVEVDKNGLWLDAYQDTAFNRRWVNRSSFDSIRTTDYRGKNGILVPIATNSRNKGLPENWITYMDDSDLRILTSKAYQSSVRVRALKKLDDQACWVVACHDDNPTIAAIALGHIENQDTLCKLLIAGNFEDHLHSADRDTAIRRLDSAHCLKVMLEAKKLDLFIAARNRALATTDSPEAYYQMLKRVLMERTTFGVGHILEDLLHELGDPEAVVQCIGQGNLLGCSGHIIDFLVLREDPEHLYQALLSEQYISWVGKEGCLDLISDVTKLIELFKKVWGKLGGTENCNVAIDEIRSSSVKALMERVMLIGEFDTFIEGIKGFLGKFLRDFRQQLYYLSYTDSWNTLCEGCLHQKGRSEGFKWLAAQQWICGEARAEMLIDGRDQSAWLVAVTIVNNPLATAAVDHLTIDNLCASFAAMPANAVTREKCKAAIIKRVNPWELFQQAIRLDENRILAHLARQNMCATPKSDMHLEQILRLISFFGKDAFGTKLGELSITGSSDPRIRDILKDYVTGKYDMLIASDYQPETPSA